METAPAETVEISPEGEILCQGVNLESEMQSRIISCLIASALLETQRISALRNEFATNGICQSVGLLFSLRNDCDIHPASHSMPPGRSLDDAWGSPGSSSPRCLGPFCLPSLEMLEESCDQISGPVLLLHVFPNRPYANLHLQDLDWVPPIAALALAKWVADLEAAEIL